MKISTRGRYALRAMLDMARHEGEDKPTTLAAVAEETGISRGYLDQLAQSLRNARLVYGVSGRHGGYRLARPASQIDVAEILRATIGPISIVECVESPEVCDRSDTCETRLVYSLANHAMVQRLASVTLADLVDPQRLAALEGEVNALVARGERDDGRSGKSARGG